MLISKNKAKQDEKLVTYCSKPRNTLILKYSQRQYNKSSEGTKHKRKGRMRIRNIQSTLNREDSGLQPPKYTVPSKMFNH